MSYPKLKERARTAAALIGGLVALLLAAELYCAGRALLMAAGMFMILACAWEFSTFAARREEYIRRAGYLTAASLAPIFAFFALLARLECAGSTAQAGMAVAASGLCLAAFAGFLVMIWAGHDGMERARGVSQELFVAIFLIGFGGSALLAIAALGSPASLIGWLVLVVCSNDIAAYFTGINLGGPKLSPFISPGKTWSGALGGLTAGALIGALLGRTLLGAQCFWSGALLAALVVAFAQVGDLAKSYLKRLHNVKDSGKLLPGHGGVLDRVDGILAAGPIVLAWLANG